LLTKAEVLIKKLKYVASNFQLEIFMWKVIKKQIKSKCLQVLCKMELLNEMTVTRIEKIFTTGVLPDFRLSRLMTRPVGKFP
jgi:hypothetical protein